MSDNIKTSIPDGLSTTLRVFCNRVDVNCVLPVRGRSDQDLALVILRYSRLVKPNYISWLARGGAGCATPAAYTVFRENLLREVNENHPAMLADFARQAYRYLDRAAYSTAEAALKEWSLEDNVVRAISDHLYTPPSPLCGCWIMAALEATSRRFIPWLREAGERLSFTDFTYVEQHGVTTTLHTEEFAWALAMEADWHREKIFPLEEHGVLPYDGDLMRVHRYLRFIFRATMPSVSDLENAARYSCILVG